MIERQKEGDIFGGAGRLTSLLQAIAAILVVTLVALFVESIGRYSELQDSIRENALWSVHQAEREVDRLRHSVHDYLDGNRAAWDDIALRYDIVYSRLSTLTTGDFTEKLRRNEEAAALIDEIQRRILALDAGLHPPAENEAATERLRAADRELDAVGEKAGRLLMLTNNLAGAARAEARAHIMQLQITKAAVAAVLIGCLVVLSLVLRRQLQSVRHAGMQFKDMAQQLDAALALAEAGNRAKSQFMATMGHEVRTPLNAILGTAELLELTASEPDTAQRLRTIRRAGEALLETINEILDFAKIEHGSYELERRPVEIATLLRQALDMVEGRAAEHGNRLLLELPEHIAVPVVLSDPTRLRQVVLNLLSNAVKFTKNGSVKLRLVEREDKDRTLLRIEVADTGIGIDRKGQKRLFQPFSQVDASISRRYGGTGLGLTICKEIIDALGGQIGVESEKGKGSTFWLELPALPAQLAQPEAPATVPVRDVAPLQILLVEDNLINQQVAIGLLAYLGHHVTTASDGIEALARVRQRRFDLILMDMQMPNMDGIEATAALRRLGGWCATVPIVAMTANASEDDRRRCEDVGMTGFQSKPIALTQLRAAIAEACPQAAAKPAACERIADRRQELVDVLGEAAYEELVESFFEDAKRLLSALPLAREKERDHLLHTLKGAALAIGLDELAAEAQALRACAPETEETDRLHNSIETWKRNLAA